MSTPRILTITATIVVAGGLLLAACGDDTEALSKDELIARADALCQTTNDELEPVCEAVYEGTEDIDPNDPTTQGLLFERFDEAMETAGPVFLQQIDDIRALAPPDEDDELIDTLLDDFEEAVTEFAATTEAAAAGDEAAMEALDSATEDPFADVNRRAREYGFTVCGEEG